jgi:hypothetical protein
MNPQLWLYKWIGHDKKQFTIYIFKFNQSDPADVRQFDSIETRGAFCCPTINNNSWFLLGVVSNMRLSTVFFLY